MSYDTVSNLFLVSVKCAQRSYQFVGYTIIKFISSTHSTRAISKEIETVTNGGRYKVDGGSVSDGDRYNIDIVQRTHITTWARQCRNGTRVRVPSTLILRLMLLQWIWFKFYRAQIGKALVLASMVNILKLYLEFIIIISIFEKHVVVKTITLSKI